MKILIFLLTVLFACFIPYHLMAIGSDTTYITQEELEPGWGLYYTEFDTTYYRIHGEEKTNMPFPKTWELMGFQVSPNGKYLAFTNNSNSTQYYSWFGLKVLNLETKEIITIDKYGWCPQWTSDSKMLIFLQIPGSQGSHFTKIWFPETNRFDSICKNCDTSCQRGGYLGPDNYFYFLSYGKYPDYKSILYRTNLDSTLKYGCTYNVQMAGTYGFEPYAPLFPPREVNYTLRQAWYPRGVISGFHLIKDFNAKNSIVTQIEFPDTSWVYSTMNTQQWGWGSMVIGPKGELYAWLSFRPKTAVGWDGNSGFDVGPFDSVGIAARNASGLYRLDTSGGNLVQLVRSWTYNPGGFDEKNPAVSISADGETIYYGFLQPDTCISIMRMNRWGRNKELVYKLERDSLNNVVNYEVKSNSLECFYNERTGELTIKYPFSLNEISELKIFDYYGNIVEKRVLNSLSQNDAVTIRINIERYTTGIYFVQLYSGSKFYFSKFLNIK